MSPEPVNTLPGLAITSPSNNISWRRSQHAASRLSSLTSYSLLANNALILWSLQNSLIVSGTCSKSLASMICKLMQIRLAWHLTQRPCALTDPTGFQLHHVAAIAAHNTKKRITCALFNGRYQRLVTVNPKVSAKPKCFFHTKFQILSAIH